MPMVGWFDPAQLARTGVQVFVSTIFGRHADHRLIEAVTQGHEIERPHRYPTHEDEVDPDEFWFDYTADVGDGWHPTYAVAHWLAQPALKLTDESGAVHDTKRGRFLVFGGDEVYPMASRREYMDRLVAPYRTALKNAAPTPHVYAIPGNHDWYDSLVSFSRLFMAGRHIGGWQTRQRRSYFAIRLPHHWWLLGIDVQLGSDVDVMQERYFREVAENQIQKGDRIILCTAEPEWVNERLYEHLDDTYAESTLRNFERHVLKPHQVSVFVAGDLHHYRRHEESRPRDGRPPRQKITAGGGGAFLHPTHKADAVDKLRAGDHTYDRMCDYPSQETSRSLCFGNLLFPWFNPKFILLAGAIYGLSTIGMKVHMLDRMSWRHAFHETLGQLADTPSFAFWVVSLIAGFVLFTDTHSRIYRWAAGTLHALAHLAASFVVSWLPLMFASTHAIDHSVGWYVAYTVWVVLVGGLAGSFLFGFYLLVSLNVFGRHANEAFSALAIQDWKNFLRFKITKDELTIYPVGIDRVPKNWLPNGETIVPNDPSATLPRVIEKQPVIIRH